MPVSISGNFDYYFAFVSEIDVKLLEVFKTKLWLRLKTTQKKPDSK
jgi:hypothetical protein